MQVSTDTKWIIGTVLGTGLALVTTLLTIASLLFAQLGSVNTRIDDMNTRIDDMNTRIDDMNTRIDDMNTRIDDMRGEFRDFRTEVRGRMEGFDTRLRNVEIAFGKVDQRLLIIERFVLPTPEQPGE